MFDFIYPKFIAYISKRRKVRVPTNIPSNQLNNFKHELSSITKTLVDFKGGKLLSGHHSRETADNSDSDLSISIRGNQLNTMA